MATANRCRWMYFLLIIGIFVYRRVGENTGNFLPASENKPFQKGSRLASPLFQRRAFEVQNGKALNLVFSWTQAAAISWWFRWYLRTTHAHNQVILFLIEGRYLPSRKLAFSKKHEACQETFCSPKMQADLFKSLPSSAQFSKSKIKEAYKRATRWIVCHQTLQIQLWWWTLYASNHTFGIRGTHHLSFNWCVAAAILSQHLEWHQLTDEVLMGDELKVLSVWKGSN